MSELKAKSVKGGRKAYLWMMIDVAGSMHALCFEAKDAKELLSNNFLVVAAGKSKKAFQRTIEGPARTVSSGLVDLGGKALQA